MRTIIINKCFPFAAMAALSATAQAATHDYVVRVAEDLSHLQVEARFAAPPSRIAARSRYAGRYLDFARDCDTGDAVRRVGRRLDVGHDLDCLEYRIDLRRAARDDRRNGSLHPGNVVVSPTRWLWRPRLDGDDAINVTFEVPDGIEVSMPWPATGNATYRLGPSPQSGSAVAVFGRFDRAYAEVADTALRVIMLRDRTSRFDQGFVDWVGDTAASIAGVYARFPNPDARVVLFPSRGRGDSPVRFGRVVRDGGETVELLVDPAGSAEDLYRSWTATHEFSHLMVPYLGRDRRWISEGFAQYYQNLLLARAGRYSEQQAWQNIRDGLERGRNSAPHLSPNQATARNARNTRMKVYWSGAALALIADVELRRRTDDRESLDTALGAFQACCLPSSRTWSGAEFFSKLDEFVSEPLFAELYRDIGETPGFPDVDALLQRLGVWHERGLVVLNDDADLAEIRATLTARRYTD